MASNPTQSERDEGRHAVGKRKDESGRTPAIRTPSTASSGEPSALPVNSATDPARARRSTTRAAVKGQPAPRLPHERDESSDSGTSPPSPMMEQAARDVNSGKRPTDRGEVTDELYERTLRNQP